MNIKFSVIDSTTGQVLSKGLTQSIDGLAGVGQQVILDTAPDDELCWWDGAKFRIAPRKEHHYQTWSWVHKQWIDPRTLSDIRADKWTEMKRARTNAINANMETPYGVFQCRDEDRTNITDAVMLANTMAAMGQPVAITWTLANNQTVTLTQTQITEVALLLGQKIQQAHTTARIKRTAIEAATTQAELDAITW